MRGLIQKIVTNNLFNDINYFPSMYTFILDCMSKNISSVYCLSPTVANIDNRLRIIYKTRFIVLKIIYSLTIITMVMLFWYLGKSDFIQSTRKKTATFNWSTRYTNFTAGIFLLTGLVFHGSWQNDRMIDACLGGCFNVIFPARPLEMS